MMRFSEKHFNIWSIGGKTWLIERGGKVWITCAGSALSQTQSYDTIYFVFWNRTVNLWPLCCLQRPKRARMERFGQV